MFHASKLRASKLAITLIAVAAVAGCAKKNGNAFAPNSARDLGINGGAGGAATPGSQKDFSTNVGDRVLFTVDSSSLTSEGRRTLDKQAQWLSRYPNYQVTVEGHADERGTREYNIALGARRAAAARKYLIARGVSRARMRTISYGKERPVAVCNDISCFSQNRRAVTLLSGGNS